MLRRTAELHKRTFLHHLDRSGVDVTLRYPVDRDPTGSTSDVSKFLGEDERETGVGTTETVKVLPSFPREESESSQRRPSRGLSVALLAESDLLLRTKLDSTLLDSNKPYGKTKFDVVKDVVVSGTAFKVVGTDRGGFGIIGPYILYVGLQSIGREA